MEQQQLDHIQKHRNNLMESIICSTPLLSRLVADRVISKSDMEDIEILRFKGGQAHQVDQLLNILQTRIGAFECLERALKDTRQSGAVAILEKFYETRTRMPQESAAHSTGKSPPAKTKAHVIGEPGYEISRICREVFDIPESAQALLENWRSLALYLGIPSFVVHHLGQSFLLMKINLTDILEQILCNFTASHAQNATVEELVEGFRFTNLNTIADHLKKTFL